jgi:hypothetical protein
MHYKMMLQKILVGANPRKRPIRNSFTWTMAGTWTMATDSTRANGILFALLDLCEDNKFFVRLSSSVKL